MALTHQQNATFDRILRAVTDSELRAVVENLALTITPLLASNRTYYGSSGAVVSTELPDHQRVLELEYWHTIAMAQFQRMLIQWATGQIAPEPKQVEYILPPLQDQDVWFCNNFIIRLPTYQSFSLVAIILIIDLGTLLIIVSLYKESFAELIITKCFKKPVPPRYWEDEDMLVQRSPRKPRPPSKDLLPVSPARRPRRRTETTTRSSIPDSHGVSPPTLPPENRKMSIIELDSNADMGLRLGLVPHKTLSRFSWVAISFDNSDTSSLDKPG